MSEIILLSPEIFLALTLAMIVGSEISYHGERTRLVTGTALFGLGCALAQTLYTASYGPTQIFGHAWIVDGLSLFFKIIAITLAALAIVGSGFAREIRSEHKAEHFTLIIGSCLATCVAASAGDVLLGFLALQAINIIGFLMVAFSKRSILSTEAAVKHLVFSAVSGALFLFGTAILFSATQTINSHEMHQVLLTHPMARETGLVVFLFLFLSLSFQMAAFPMSLTTPDTLQGAPTPVSSFLAVGSRAAAFALSFRLFFALFAQPGAEPGSWVVLGSLQWPRVVGLMAGITLLFGSLLAFRQTGAKRLVAYLWVAEAGFLLLGLLVMDAVGLAALLYNLVVQLFALTGAYFVLTRIYDELGSDRLVDLKGMLSRGIPECVCLILFLACLVGLPPFPGFIGKFALIGVALQHKWYFLAAIAVLASTITTIAIVRLSYSLVGDLRSVVSNLPSASTTRELVPQRVYLGILLLPILLLGVFADSVLRWAGQSLQFILW